MTEKEFKKLLQDSLKKEFSDLNEFNLLVKASDLNKGKINKRLLKYLPENCTFEIKHLMYYVYFPSGNSHLLGWINSTLELTFESLCKSDSWAKNGAEERISKINDILNNPIRFNDILKTQNKLEKIYKDIKDIYNTYDSLKIDSFYNPVYYELLRIAIPNKKHFDLFLKFKYSL